MRVLANCSYCAYVLASSSYCAYSLAPATARTRWLQLLRVLASSSHCAYWLARVLANCSYCVRTLFSQLYVCLAHSRNPAKSLRDSKARSLTADEASVSCWNCVIAVGQGVFRGRARSQRWTPRCSVAAPWSRPARSVPGCSCFASCCSARLHCCCYERAPV